MSRRDDLESIGYMLIHFALGTLPWIKMKHVGSNRTEKRRETNDKKLSVSIEELCKDLPKELAVYMNYCRKLKFDEDPDYGYLRRLFHDLFMQQATLFNTK